MSPVMLLVCGALNSKDWNLPLMILQKMQAALVDVILNTEFCIG